MSGAHGHPRGQPSWRANYPQRWKKPQIFFSGLGHVTIETAILAKGGWKPMSETSSPPSADLRVLACSEGAMKLIL